MHVFGSLPSSFSIDVGSSARADLLAVQMVLNVLFCAGAVPLRPEEQTHPTSTTTNSNNSAEYVQFLEQLVGELSHVFAQWVHQNPIADGMDSTTATAGRHLNSRHFSRGKQPLPRPPPVPHPLLICMPFARLIIIPTSLTTFSFVWPGARTFNSFQAARNVLSL